MTILIAILPGGGTVGHHHLVVVSPTQIRVDEWLMPNALFPVQLLKIGIVDL